MSKKLVRENEALFEKNAKLESENELLREQYAKLLKTSIEDAIKKANLSKLNPDQQKEKRAELQKFVEDLNINFNEKNELMDAKGMYVMHNNHFFTSISEFVDELAIDYNAVNRDPNAEPDVYRKLYLSPGVSDAYKELYKAATGDNPDADRDPLELIELSENAKRIKEGYFENKAKKREQERKSDEAFRKLLTS